MPKFTRARDRRSCLGFLVFLVSSKSTPVIRISRNVLFSLRICFFVLCLTRLAFLTVKRSKHSLFHSGTKGYVCLPRSSFVSPNPTVRGPGVGRSCSVCVSCFVASFLLSYLACQWPRVFHRETRPYLLCFCFIRFPKSTISVQAVERSCSKCLSYSLAQI